MPRKRILVTARKLRGAGACKCAVSVFRRLWPEGAVVNVRNLKRASRHELNVHFLEKFLWSSAAFDDFNRREQRLTGRRNKAITRINDEDERDGDRLAEAGKLTDKAVERLDDRYRRKANAIYSRYDHEYALLLSAAWRKMEKEGGRRVRA